MLDVPGARLYYEVQGTGPVIMFIGHPMDTTGFAQIAPLFAEDHTVVTYDPRGFAKSTIEDRGQDADPELLADDVRRVLEAVGQGPADVFGSSGGAVTGLALAAHHPSVVRTLVAHEPPLALAVPDAEEARAGAQKVYDTYKNNGIGAAWQQFFVFTGMNMRPQEPAADAQQEPTDEQQGPTEAQEGPSEAMVATSERFFGQGLLPITLYEPDYAALISGPVRVVVAGGIASKGEYAQRTAAALADRLGTALVDFPGDHAGFFSQAKDFAPVLRGVL